MEKNKEYTTEKKKQLLTNFLMENNCYDIFVKNVENHNIYNRTFDGMCEYIITTIIVYAFIWHKTEQGFQFWYEINKKWNLFLKNI